MHRAQLLRLHGDWPAALEASAPGRRRFAEAMNPGAIAKGWYLQGEVQRLSGRFEEAEKAYREASRLGLEPQPGLALLRLAQGKEEAAAAAIRRAAGRDDRSRGSAQACCRRTSRSCSRPATSTRRATPAVSSARSRLKYESRHAPGRRHAGLRARSSSLQAMREARWSAFGMRSRPGRSSRLPTR